MPTIGPKIGWNTEQNSAFGSKLKRVSEVSLASSKTFRMLENFRYWNAWNYILRLMHFSSTFISTASSIQLWVSVCVWKSEKLETFPNIKRIGCFVDIFYFSNIHSMCSIYVLSTCGCTCDQGWHSSPGWTCTRGECRWRRCRGSLVGRP